MLDSMKALAWNMKLQAEMFIAQMHFQSSDIIRLVSCFGFGFLAGLILRRSFKYMVLFATISILLLASLQYFDLITINIVKVQQVTGTEEIQSFESAVSLISNITKQYVFEATSGGIGLFLGFKTG